MVTLPFSRTRRLAVAEPQPLRVGDSGAGSNDVPPRLQNNRGGCQPFAGEPRSQETAGGGNLDGGLTTRRKATRWIILCYHDFTDKTREPWGQLGFRIMFGLWKRLRLYL